MTKDLYLNFLGRLLREHYKSIKETGSASSDSQQFINGYLTAARKLNAVYQKELNDFAEVIHFEVFNMTVAERKKAFQIKPGPQEAPVKSDQSEADEAEPELTGNPEISKDDEFDTPAYKRKGIKLKF